MQGCSHSPEAEGAWLDPRVCPLKLHRTVAMRTQASNSDVEAESVMSVQVLVTVFIYFCAV